MDKNTRRKRSLSCLSEQNLCQEIHFIFVGTSYLISRACLRSVYVFSTSSSSVPAPVQFFWGILVLWCSQSHPGREGCPGVAQDSLEVPWLLQPVPRPPPMLGLSLLNAQLMHLWNGKVHRAGSGPSLSGVRPLQVMPRGSIARKERWRGFLSFGTLLCKGWCLFLQNLLCYRRKENWWDNFMLYWARKDCYVHLLWHLCSIRFHYSVIPIQTSIYIKPYSLKQSTHS